MTHRHCDPVTMDHIIELRKRVALLEKQLENALAWVTAKQREEAANEIKQLRKDKQLGFELMDTFVKEINRLKQVLQQIAEEGSGHGQALAYAALKEKE